MKNSILVLPFLLLASTTWAQATGTLQVNGQASKVQIFQKVKAIRCEAPGKCDAAVLFDLNKPQALPVGSYIVGYENSIHPEMVRLEAGRSQVLNLLTVSVPAEVKGQKIKVYRDLTTSIEQRKVLMSFYQMKQHFFRLEADRFADLYLTGSWDRDFVRRFDYSICGSIQDYKKANSHVPDAAVQMCRIWTGAKSAGDLAGLFKFMNDGSFEQNWVSYPGDLFITKVPRHLVAVPVTDADTISVFAGAYRFQSEDAAIAAVSVKVGI